MPKTKNMTDQMQNIDRSLKRESKRFDYDKPVTENRKAEDKYNTMLKLKRNSPSKAHNKASDLVKEHRTNKKRIFGKGN